jgi:hypothetical protein
MNTCSYIIGATDEIQQGLNILSSEIYQPTPEQIKDWEKLDELVHLHLLV